DPGGGQAADITLHGQGRGAAHRHAAGASKARPGVGAVVRERGEIPGGAGDEDGSSGSSDQGNRHRVPAPAGGGNGSEEAGQPGVPGSGVGPGVLPAATGLSAGSRG